MGKITLDPETAEKLSAATGDIPLFAPDGRPVGYFLPPDAYEHVMAYRDRSNTQASTEELRRASANPKRHTMDEVWKLFEGS